VVIAGGCKAVFLDRDGVINANTVRSGRPYAPRSVEDFHILPGVEEAVLSLKKAGFKVVVATNQPDIAAGLISQAVLDEMHAILRAKLSVDDVEVCYHSDADGCDCRKPKPGLLLSAASKHAIDLRTSYMVGDRWRDVAAGRSAGCQTVFVDYHYDEPLPDRPDAVVANLSEAADWILRREKEKMLG
jgi:D-glycero-D-manno-heptose 1,7-bisphosphate phosphatase